MDFPLPGLPEGGGKGASCNVHESIQYTKRIYKVVPQS